MRSVVSISLMAAISLAMSGLVPSFAGSDAKGQGAAKQCKAGDNCCEEHQKVCKQRISVCITNCQKAVKALEKKKGDAKLIGTIKECIETCKSHRDHKMSAGDCAAKCEACAKACEEAKDPELKSCVESCKSCAECCSAEKKHAS